MNVYIDGVEYKPISEEINVKVPLGDALKAYRKFIKNETLNEACKGIGIAKSHLWEIEKNNTNPSLKVAIDIAKYYGFPMSDYEKVIIC